MFMSYDKFLKFILSGLSYFGLLILGFLINVFSYLFWIIINFVILYLIILLIGYFT